jgi:flagellar basal body-associated protein FliL
MAEEQTEPEPEKKSGGIMNLVIWLVVVVVAIGGGFATPMLVAKLNAPVEEVEEPEMPVPDLTEEVEYIEFDEVVAAFGGTRGGRFLKMNISLQVAKSQRMEIEAQVDARKAKIKDRIISHISEMTIEEFQGRFAQNALRRYLVRIFNETLFDDGLERIQDILFTDLTPS